jgi:hypothetical protein
MSIKLENISLEMLELSVDDLEKVVGGTSSSKVLDGTSVSSEIYLRPPTLMERIACAENGVKC